VQCMLTAKWAILAQLQLLSRRTLVLVRRVVLPLAIGASQTQQFTHISNSRGDKAAAVLAAAALVNILT